MNTPLIIVQRELDILKKYLHESVLTDFNKKNLLSELASAQIVEEHELPCDVISLNAVVHVQERQSKQSFVFQIVSPAAADVRKNKVSVLAPIAIALLGYRKGSTAQWEMPGGVQEFEILKVTRIDLQQAVDG
ncbi:GreA/GreB family elongation factor [Mucilaginibacter ginsenosidivorans]|jgi:regulator of nucleoside diphosphate kinase|uniref:GreA/GreB family elongation factor n=1 Tax=Mucilaginibacter ginsenosidivorans TaxID=398053 RepID=A0A5B8UVM2_9SPHI|nr:GreA/GreB family elongation factor [Mucilaginibacter ginsenosidivorans]QEC62381.1 GreA/GreB family elongation factor [Mucilaginibacter ginsenosidivorans]